MNLGDIITNKLNQIKNIDMAKLDEESFDKFYAEFMEEFIEYFGRDLEKEVKTVFNTVNRLVSEISILMEKYEKKVSAGEDETCSCCQCCKHKHSPEFSIKEAFRAARKESEQKSDEKQAEGNPRVVEYNGIKIIYRKPPK